MQPTLRSTFLTFVVLCACADEAAERAAGQSDNNRSETAAFACLTGDNDINGPQCLTYLATGKDAVSYIKKLRAECTGQFVDAPLTVVDACPTEGLVGACETPKTPRDGADITLILTRHSYESALDPVAPQSPESVMRICANEGGMYLSTDEIIEMMR